MGGEFEFMAVTYPAALQAGNVMSQKSLSVPHHHKTERQHAFPDPICRAALHAPRPVGQLKQFLGRIFRPFFRVAGRRPGSEWQSDPDLQRALEPLAGQLRAEPFC
jgi:hypothetical protein